MQIFYIYKQIDEIRLTLEQQRVYEVSDTEKTSDKRFT